MASQSGKQNFPLGTADAAIRDVWELSGIQNAPPSSNMGDHPTALRSLGLSHASQPTGGPRRLESGAMDGQIGEAWTHLSTTPISDRLGPKLRLLWAAGCPPSWAVFKNHR